MDLAALRDSLIRVISTGQFFRSHEQTNGKTVSRHSQTHESHTIFDCVGDSRNFAREAELFSGSSTCCTADPMQPVKFAKSNWNRKMPYDGNVFDVVASELQEIFYQSKTPGGMCDEKCIACRYFFARFCSVCLDRRNLAYVCSGKRFNAEGAGSSSYADRIGEDRFR